MSDPDIDDVWAEIERRLAERTRIVEALAAIHRMAPHVADPDYPDIPFCENCGRGVDADGDCPTMRIVKGKV